MGMQNVSLESVSPLMPSCRVEFVSQLSAFIVFMVSTATDYLRHFLPSNKAISEDLALV